MYQQRYINNSALTYTKTTIIRMLRGYIYNSENYAHLLDDTKITVEDIKKCKVYDGYANILTEFPMCVVTGTNGTMNMIGLGDFKQEQTNEFGDIIGYLYGGTYNFNINLEIAALTSYQADFLSDFFVNALRMYLYRKLEAEGILIINQVNYGGQQVINEKNNQIFIPTISFPVWTQWNQYIDLLDLKNINLEIDTKEE
jgi:hypothetical protein